MAQATQASHDLYSSHSNSRINKHSFFAIDNRLSSISKGRFYGASKRVNTAAESKQRREIKARIIKRSLFDDTFFSTQRRLKPTQKSLDGFNNESKVSTQGLLRNIQKPRPKTGANKTNQMDFSKMTGDHVRIDSLLYSGHKAPSQL